MFVITEFVITEFDCTFFHSQRFMLVWNRLITYEACKVNFWPRSNEIHILPLKIFKCLSATFLRLTTRPNIFQFGSFQKKRRSNFCILYFEKKLISCRILLSKVHKNFFEFMSHKMFLNLTLLKWDIMANVKADFLVCKRVSFSFFNL